MGLLLEPRRERLAEALACVIDPRDADGLPGVLATIGKTGQAKSVRVGKRSVYLPPLILGWDHLTYAVTDPAEAWEALHTRGLIPADWIESPGRRFDRPVDSRPSGYVHVAQAHPPTVRDCVLLAADVPNVLTAERIALEATKARVVVWRFCPARDALAYVHSTDRARSRGTAALVGAQWEIVDGRTRLDPTTPGTSTAYAYDLLQTGYALHGYTRDETVTLICPT